jgi:hypothetical protein
MRVGNYLKNYLNCCLKRKNNSNNENESVELNSPKLINFDILKQFQGLGNYENISIKLVSNNINASKFNSIEAVKSAILLIKTAIKNMGNQSSLYIDKNKLPQQEQDAINNLNELYNIIKHKDIVSMKQILGFMVFNILANAGIIYGASKIGNKTSIDIQKNPLKCIEDVSDYYQSHHEDQGSIYFNSKTIASCSDDKTDEFNDISNYIIQNYRNDGFNGGYFPEYINRDNRSCDGQLKIWLLSIRNKFQNWKWEKYSLDYIPSFDLPSNMSGDDKVLCEKAKIIFDQVVKDIYTHKLWSNQRLTKLSLDNIVFNAITRFVDKKITNGEFNENNK